MSVETRPLPELIGQSPVLLAMLEQVSTLAAIDRPVLVVGERGTGKELVAARLHYLSPRWARPFVRLNVAAVAESLLDSELFGHEAGAFTGAVRRHEGRFERADGGTLFLDEVGTASQPVQEKLLRVIEYGEMDRVGGRGTLSVDVRVIAATNADLTRPASGFRADLLDRLAFDVVHVPPLRRRGDDVVLLAEHFGRAMAAELGWATFPGFSAAAREALRAHPWPGNVRELRNAVERSVAHWPDRRRPVGELLLDPFRAPWGEDAPSATADVEAVADSSLDARLHAVERRALEEALAATRFNRRRAAERLGLSYEQLRVRLRRHGL